jgi:hypothetical protein
MATVLSGTSGALYYKPAGTKDDQLAATAFPSSGSDITVGTYLNFKVNDQVTLAYPTGATTTNAIAAGDYYVLTYTASTGVMTLSSTEGGSAVTATAQPSGFGTEKASISFKSFQSVANVRSWSFEVTREEIDVTSIGGTLAQSAPFRTFISGFADGSGSAEVYFTDDDTGISSRLIEDVTQRNQAGATFKLYMDAVVSSGTVNDTTSRSIELEAVLTSASYAVSPDDAQTVSISFRPTSAPTFDFDKS